MVFSRSLGVTLIGCPSNGAQGQPTEALRHCAAQPVANGRQEETKQKTVERAMAEKVACARKTQEKMGDL